LIRPVAAGLAKLKPVISLELAGTAVTVTVYTFVLPSSAVTVYVTGPLKFCAVPGAGLMLAPVWVMAGTSAVRFVPKGTLTLIFVPLIRPVAAGLAKLKPVIALESERGVSSGSVGQAPRAKTRAITAAKTAVLLNARRGGGKRVTG
jgi:hypothetical protein